MKTSIQPQTRNHFKKGGILLLAFTVLITGAVGVSAYFSDSEQTVNTFTVGKISIEHQEEEWDRLPESEKKNITPNQTIVKDPKVTNTGDNAAYVFQVVQVPCKELYTANLDGTKNDKALVDLFHYVINGGWTLLDTTDVVTDGEITAHQYVYGYGTTQNCTALQAGDATPTLFDSVTMANVLEGQGLESTKMNIVIDAYGIQTTNLGNSGSVTPLEIFHMVSNQRKD